MDISLSIFRYVHVPTKPQRATEADDLSNTEISCLKGDLLPTLSSPLGDLASF